MVKRALCVGINKYPRPDLELRGLRQRRQGVGELLVDHYDFARPDVKVMTNAKATKRDMLDALEGPARPGGEGRRPGVHQLLARHVRRRHRRRRVAATTKRSARTTATPT